MPIVVCQHCCASFATPQWRLNQGKGKYCSRSCAVEAMRGWNSIYPYEYMAYHDAKRRCTNPYHFNTTKNYKDRGIEFLFKSFEEFINCVGSRPEGTSLDRIDNNGNYEKGNVRWASIKQQAVNRRSTKFFTLNGETLCAADWDDRLGLSRGTVSRRIFKYKWPLHKALTTQARH